MKGNHNTAMAVVGPVALCSTYQRYKMKGNHNTRADNGEKYPIVFNISKIQNERKSQQVYKELGKRADCVQHIKDTK